MYCKVHSKILDSSVWLECLATRVVWLTLMVSMDEDGFCSFASVPNLARRANVTLPEAKAALITLEGPDADSSDPDHDGRRVERVPGGWIVLNAQKYREIVRRKDAREVTRLRVERFREQKKSAPSDEPSVTVNRYNGQDVTLDRYKKGAGNAPVTPSEADTEAEAEAETEKTLPGATPPRPPAAQPDLPMPTPDEVAGQTDPVMEKPARLQHKAEQDTLNASIDRLFAYYCRKLGRDPTRYTLTEARRKKAQSRLREREKLHDPDAAVHEARQCIDNLAASPYHRENGHVDWTEQIFRSAEEFEKRLNWQKPVGGVAHGKPGVSEAIAVRQGLLDERAAGRVADGSDYHGGGPYAGVSGAEPRSESPALRLVHGNP